MNVGLVGRRCLAKLREFRSADGLAITEYGLLIALMALALIAGLVVFGGGMSTWLATKTAQVTTN